MSVLEAARSLLKQGKVREAETALEAGPLKGVEGCNACQLLAHLKLKRGEMNEALVWLEKAVELQPKDMGVWLTLADVLERADLRERAEAAYRCAAKVDDGTGLGWASYGLHLAQGEAFEAAIVAMENAVARDRKNPAFVANYAGVLRKLGQVSEAIAVFEEAIALEPGNAVAYNSLGEAWQAKGYPEKAISCFRKAVELKSDYGSAWGNLGIALHKEGALSEAEDAFRHALQLESSQANHWACFGALMRDGCRLDEAKESFVQALKLGNCDRPIVSKYLYTLNFLTDLPAADVAAEHVVWSRSLAAEERRKTKPVRFEKDRPVTIGFVSGDFSSHSVAFFLLPLYEAIDRSRFRVCSVTETDVEDRMTSRFRELSDIWIDSRGVSADRVASTLEQEGVDVLIDLAGHTAGARLDVLEAASVPLTLSWLGYPNVTGSVGVDARIVDSITDPDECAWEGSGESLKRIEGCFLSYRFSDELPEVTALPYQANGYVTFGSFNNAAKLNEKVVSVWSDVLNRVSDSRLILKSWQFDDRQLAERMRAAFVAQGIASDRIELLGRVASHPAHLAVYNRIDIALDTFPYNGTTTTCEALAMGVPTVTIAGNCHAARVGASVLRSAQLEDWVAEDEGSFVAKAVAFSSDAEHLAELRSSMRERLRRSPLGDVVAFARRFEKLIDSTLENMSNAKTVTGWIEKIDFGDLTTDGALVQSTVLDRLPSSFAGARVLDATCVDGALAVEAMRRGAKEVASLPAEGFGQFEKDGQFRSVRSVYYRECRERLGLDEARMRLLGMQLYHVSPASIGSYDWVLMTVNVNLMRHLAFALDAVRGVCAGKLFLSLELSSLDGEGAYLEIGDGPMWRPSRNGLEALLKLSGFEIESFYETAGEEGGRSATVVASIAAEADER